MRNRSFGGRNFRGHKKKKKEKISTNSKKKQKKRYSNDSYSESESIKYTKIYKLNTEMLVEEF